MNFLISLSEKREKQEGSLPQEETISITITNLGAKPIQLDIGTLQLERKNERFKPCIEAQGRYEVDQPTLAPGGHCVVELSYSSFLQLLKLDPPAHHNEKTFNKEAAVCLSVRALGGKLYASSRNHYSEDLGTFFYD